MTILLSHILNQTHSCSLTGCSLNIVFFSNILKYIPVSLGFPRWCQCVYTMAGQTQALQKNHNILRKNTIFNEHPVGPPRQTCSKGPHLHAFWAKPPTM